jgi:hypothetical protein
LDEIGLIQEELSAAAEAASDPAAVGQFLGNAKQKMERLSQIYSEHLNRAAALTEENALLKQKLDSFQHHAEEEETCKLCKKRYIANHNKDDS